MPPPEAGFGLRLQRHGAEVAARARRELDARNAAAGRMRYERMRKIIRGAARLLDLTRAYNSPPLRSDCPQ